MKAIKKRFGLLGFLVALMVMAAPVSALADSPPDPVQNLHFSSFSDYQRVLEWDVPEDNDYDHIEILILEDYQVIDTIELYSNRNFYYDYTRLQPGSFYIWIVRTVDGVYGANQSLEYRN